MSQRDEFQVWLPSSVKSNTKNRPGKYETTLARPLELPGTWEVALMDVSYPHNWINIASECVVGVSYFVPAQHVSEQANIIVEPRHLDFLQALISYRPIARYRPVDSSTVIE